MPRIVTALFKERAQAEQALQALLTTGIAQTRITAIGLDEGREVSSISGFRSLDISEESRAALRSLRIPEDDLKLFEQGLRRGCRLIAARIDREDHEEAVRVLEMFDPVDLDRDSQEWVKESRSSQGEADVGRPLAAGITGGSTAGTTNTGVLPGMGQMSEAADDLGSADLRAGETGQPNAGAGTTTGTGARRSDERADREGVNELTAASQPSPDQPALLQRHMNRGGRIWVFGSVEGDTL